MAFGYHLQYSFVFLNSLNKKKKWLSFIWQAKSVFLWGRGAVSVWRAECVARFTECILSHIASAGNTHSASSGVFFVFVFLNICLLFVCARFSCGMRGLSVAAPGISSCSTWDLVPWPRIDLGPPALGAQSLSHQATREVPASSGFDDHLNSENTKNWRMI